MANFYKMDPILWDHATVDLTLEEEAAYLRIVNAIYRSERGCPNNDRVLAGMFRVSTRKAKSLVNSLIQHGKIFIRDDMLWNEKAERELTSIRGKKSDETKTNAARNEIETPANTTRNGDERSTNAARNEDETPNKPLKDIVSTRGDPPIKTKTKTETREDKDSLKKAFEDLWIEYPRRRTDADTLTKGSKQKAFEQFKRLPDEERAQAIELLPAYKRVYPDDSKGVCDAERYFSHKRWLDLDGLAAKPSEGVMVPRGELGGKVKRLVSVIGVAKYRSWFENNGHCRIQSSGDGVQINVDGEFQAERIKADFFNALNSVFGFGKWKTEIRRNVAA